ncbi:MAG: hypothetical protein ACFFD1_12875 [Candidatus Thorarchaeota archaeon]
MTEQHDFTVFKLEKFKKFYKKWKKIPLDQVISKLEENDFNSYTESLYLNANEFIKRNEDKYFILTLNHLLMLEFLLKTLVNDVFGTNNTSLRNDNFQEISEKLVFYMANVNNFRIILINNITDWVVNRYEFANLNCLLYEKLANDEIKKIHKIKPIFEKQFKKYFDLKSELQKNTFEDLSYTITKAIEIGEALFEKTPKGKKFTRM